MPLRVNHNTTENTCPASFWLWAMLISHIALYFLILDIYQRLCKWLYKKGGLNTLKNTFLSIKLHAENAEGGVLDFPQVYEKSINEMQKSEN